MGRKQSCEEQSKESEADGTARTITLKQESIWLVYLGNKKVVSVHVEIQAEIRSSRAS